MARELYVDFVGNSENRPVRGVRLVAGTNISVHEGSEGENVFYAGETGAATVSNVKTNAQGFFEVWLTEGRYDVNIPHFQISKTISIINQSSIGTGGGELGPESVTESKIAKEAVSKTKLSKAVQEEIEAGGSASPTGPAGGDLTGTYPDPTVGAEKITKAKLSSALQAEITSKGTAESFTAEIGNGASSEFTVTHNLETTGVVWNIFETASPHRVVKEFGGYPEVKIASTNTITVIFASAPTSKQYTVSVAAGGITGKEGPAGPPGPEGPEGTATLIGAAGGDLAGSYPNPTIGSEKVVTTAVKNAAITKEKLSSGVQTELAEKAGVSIVKEFVDFNSFFNVKGEKKGVTAAEAAETVAGHKRDCAPTIQEALLKAAVGGGSVSCSEPGTYYLESTRISTNAKAYPKLKTPYEAATFNACLHVPHNVTLGAPNSNTGAMQLEVGPQVWQTCITERTINPNYACVGIGTEPPRTKEQVNYTSFTLGCSAPLSSWLKSKSPPPLPDGMYAAGSGIYGGITMTGGFRYGLVLGANHLQLDKCNGGGWAALAWTNWGSEGAITGNSELLYCALEGGYCAAYVESKCSIGSIRMTGGWLGFNTAGPIFYKPTTVKPNFIQGLKMTGCQFELGRGPLFYNEDGQGNISRVTLINVQMGGADATMAAPGLNGDPSIGYRPEEGVEQFGAAVDAFIKAATVSDLNCEGTLLGEVGWGADAAGIIATKSIQNCNLGNLTEPIGKCRYRGIPLVSSPIVKEVTGTCEVPSGQNASVSIAFANAEVKNGEILRNAASTETASSLAVEVFNKKEGTLAGQALLTAPAKTYVPVLRKNPAVPVVARVPLAQLGFAEGEVGAIPPLPRGGKLTLSAAMENGSATGAEHATVLSIYNTFSYKGAIYLTGLADLPASGTLSFGGAGTIFTYRQKIARGTVTEPKVKMTAKSYELTNVKVSGVSSIKGLAPGMLITGTGIPINTQIEVVDEENFRLILTNEATKTEEQTLRVEAATNILEGTLFGSSTRCTEAINLASMTGAGTIKVISTAGMESEGSVKFQVRPFTAKAATLTIEYTSKTSTELKGCKITKASSNVCPIGTILTPTGTAKLQAHARIYRVAEIEAPAPPSSAYEGIERGLSATPIEFEVASSTAFATEGRGIVKTVTELPAEVTFEKTTTKVKVVDASVFPEKPPKGKEGEKIGKLEIGPNVTADLMSVNYATNELTVVFKALSPSHKTQPKGQYVQLNPIEVVWTGKETKKLTGLEALAGQPEHRIHKGATITQLVVSQGGGVVEGENEAAEIQKMGYQGQSEAKGKTYLYGILTPGGGGGIASGKELTDLTVLPVEGSGFPAGPAAAIKVGGSTHVVFDYTEFIAASGEAAGSESEEGEGEEEEGGGEGEEEEAVSSKGLARGFFVGISKVFQNGKEESGGSSGTYTGATQVNAEIKTSETVTEVTVLSTAKYPSTGVLLLGKDEVTYTAIASPTIFTVSSYKPTANIVVGVGAPLAPGKQVKADETVRVAYGGSGHEGEGDKGIGRVGGEGERIGTAVENDLSGSVLVQI